MVVEVEKEFGIEGKSKRESKRCAHLGIIETSLSLSPEFDFWVDYETVLTREQRFAMLGRSKFYLSARSFVEEGWTIWDSRREWNRILSSIRTVADVFSSLKHSYSSLLPSHCRLHAKFRPKSYNRSGNSDSVNVVQYEDDGSKAYLKDIARSHSIRLDPVDAPKELFKYRKRIQRIISWAYANGLVPTMMTLTTFHRWDNLKELCNVLRKSWQSLLGSHWGRRWRKSVDLQGFICRQEETINDTEENNSGWHPHYHVILFVPRELVQTLSNSEVALREQWLKWIKKYYHEETGKEILYAYINTGDASSFIPSNTGPIIRTIDFAIHTVIQNAKNVQAVIDQSFAYVSVADFKSHVESNHPHLNMPNHYLNVTDTNKLWAVDEDNHLHQMSVGNAREILLNGVDEKISENKVNIDELKLFTDASNELGLDANLMIVEDFNPATTVDDFEVKVLSCAKGGKLIGVESDVDILKGAYYWITDGINQELVQVAGVIYSTDYYHVTLANNLANDYIVSHTYLQRTTFKNGVGNVDLKNVTWTPRSLFKGIEANIERELIFDTSHKNKNALVIEGEGFCTTDGYFTLKNSYGGFELTDAEEDEGYAFSTDEEIATLFEG